MHCKPWHPRRPLLLGLLIGIFCWPALSTAAADAGSSGAPDFPKALDAYQDASGATLMQVLKDRISAEPFNLIATAIFFLAIMHTFLVPVFLRMAHRFQKRHEARLHREGKATPGQALPEVSFKAEAFHFLGEIEAIFGIWVIPLLVAIISYKGWPVARDYLGHRLNFTEPMFVVVIMTLAASRPILKLSERIMSVVAGFGGRTPAAWWFSIMTVGPVLGSFITEPAAMTISALLLADRFYALKPTPRFAYASLGLLFVNVSVGGTLTHFAAPPVLMVAGKWGWGMSHMFLHFGWKAVLGILIANVVYFFFFRREFANLNASKVSASSGQKETAPAWVTLVHLAFLGWTVVNNHYPVLFIGGFLFFLAFKQATEHHQRELSLRPALLVGFFLAGLVVHGGLQGWWIEPVLSQLGERPLFFGAMGLTAFNDNAAITYLASLVPEFTDVMKHAVVAGAVAGGGLTVIANAPNPAGQSILSKFFPDGVSPIHLALGALIPTAIVALIFQVL